MIPETPIAKCLYAIFHMAKGDVEPTSIIWIFYALESIFNCKAGENFSALHRRICSFFNLTTTDEKRFKTKLRSLYDLRSSLVHGGAEIAHPARNEHIDPRVDGASWKYVEAQDFGCALIIATLQRLIGLGWTNIRFEESMRGEMLIEEITSPPPPPASPATAPDTSP